MALLTIQNLALGYESRAIQEDLSFTVEAGEYLCIVGENGSGKSTLMKTLLGLTPPLGGTITYSDGLAKNEIGYLPQQTEVQRDFPPPSGRSSSPAALAAPASGPSTGRPTGSWPAE